MIDQKTRFAWCDCITMATGEWNLHGKQLLEGILIREDIP